MLSVLPRNFRTFEVFQSVNARPGCEPYSKKTKYCILLSGLLQLANIHNLLPSYACTTLFCCHLSPRRPVVFVDNHKWREGWKNNCYTVLGANFLFGIQLNSWQLDVISMQTLWTWACNQVVVLLSIMECNCSVPVLLPGSQWRWQQLCNRIAFHHIWINGHYVFLVRCPRAEHLYEKVIMQINNFYLWLSGKVE